MDTLRYGWLGYRFEDDSELQVGIHQVPFGLTPYASHNAWFGVPYYVGLADDYDMGIQYRREDGPWSTRLAFYKNEELNNSTATWTATRSTWCSGRRPAERGDQPAQRPRRLHPGQGHRLRDRAGRLRHSGRSCTMPPPTSAAITGRQPCTSTAAAAAGTCSCRASATQYDPVRIPAGVTATAVRVGAFEGSYEIASEADMVSRQHRLQLPRRPGTWIDQHYLLQRLLAVCSRTAGDARDSQINTIGCAIGSGPLFTYVDYILANNMAFFGNGSMGGRPATTNGAAASTSTWAFYW
ncbi:MAG: hypothetical protein U5R48_13825 [Gammaproteobacteria bacterium]|nr:hypothetical protein [Gammaproteobacteria bacterium]